MFGVISFIEFISNWFLYYFLQLRKKQTNKSTTKWEKQQRGNRLIDSIRYAFISIVSWHISNVTWHDQAHLSILAFRTFNLLVFFLCFLSLLSLLYLSFASFSLNLVVAWWKPLYPRNVYTKCSFNQLFRPRCVHVSHSLSLAAFFYVFFSFEFKT